MNRRSSEGHRPGRRASGVAQAGRQPDVERLERDSFILLQHVYTVTDADPEVPVNASRVGCDLGFAQEETARLLRYLNWVGFLRESAAGPHLSLAEEGIEYLEHGAGRRHSVRAGEKDIPIPVLRGR